MKTTPLHVEPKVSAAHAAEFLDGYLHCALWAETDDTSGDLATPLDENYEVSDFAEEAMRQAEEECNDFIEANKADLFRYVAEIRLKSENPWSSAGHDFWLTRNGHGAGYWDRGVGEVGERLTTAAKVYRERHPYVGDDKRIHWE